MKETRPKAPLTLVSILSYSPYKSCRSRVCYWRLAKVPLAPFTKPTIWHTLSPSCRSPFFIILSRSSVICNLRLSVFGSQIGFICWSFEMFTSSCFKDMFFCFLQFKENLSVSFALRLRLGYRLLFWIFWFVGCFLCNWVLLYHDAFDLILYA